MGNIFNNFCNWLSDKINELQAILFALLPDSPFQLSFPPEVQELLCYINWLIPFYLFGNTLMVWCAAILIYYSYQTIMRWVKAIE